MLIYSNQIEMPRIQVHQMEKDMTRNITRKKTRSIIIARNIWNGKSFGYLKKMRKLSAL